MSYDLYHGMTYATALDLGNARLGSHRRTGCHQLPHWQAAAAWSHADPWNDPYGTLGSPRPPGALDHPEIREICGLRSVCTAELADSQLLACTVYLHAHTPLLACDAGTQHALDRREVSVLLRNFNTRLVRGSSSSGSPKSKQKSLFNTPLPRTPQPHPTLPQSHTVYTHNLGFGGDTIPTPLPTRQIWYVLNWKSHCSIECFQRIGLGDTLSFGATMPEGT